MMDAEHPKSEQTLLALDFVFKTGLKKLEDQDGLIDAIDVKMGVLIGFLGAFIVGLLAVAFTSDARKALPLVWYPTKAILTLGVVLIGFSLYFAFQAFRTREYSLGLNVQDLSDWCNATEQEIKNAFLPTILKAIEESKEQLKLKGDSARKAIWNVFAALVALWATVLLLGIQFLMRR